MLFSEQEVLQYIEENDVKFIRLAFCDAFGELRNISVMDQDMAEAFEKGTAINPSEIGGFPDNDGQDILLFPIPETLTLLPWRPQRGRVIRMFCELKRFDGTPFIGDMRSMLTVTEKKLKVAGIDCIIGTDCEFYLFETDENGNPTKTPQDFAGCFDIAPRDKGENVRREICFTINEMGIMPRRSHHERGPGQNEIDFRYTSLTRAADNFITFKTTVKTIAAKNGLFASFCPMPLDKFDGNGLHINIILLKDGHNIFSDDRTAEQKHIAEAFTEGVLQRMREITLFLNPSVNSFKRFEFGKVLTDINWSKRNDKGLVSITEVSHNTRLKLRSPDSACNPYIAFSLLLQAGLEGIEKGLELRAENASSEKLPSALSEAIAEAEKSEFVKTYLDRDILDKFVLQKKNEIKNYKTAADKNEYSFENFFKLL